MLKKLIKAACMALGALCAAAAVYWGIYGDQLQKEYFAYRKNAAPVLMYHGVGKDDDSIDWPKSLLMPPELFEAHLRYLKENGYTLVSVEQLAQRLEQQQSVDRYIALSFDDGYKNNYEVVLPLLEKYQAKASFFVINKDIGDALHMDEKQIKTLIDKGMELGSHTTSHAPLALIDEKYLAWELATSRYYLKKKFDGYIVRTLAYPNGSYNETVINKAREYGFYRALTGHVGANTAASYNAAPMEMYRVTVADDGNGMEGFKRRLEQAYLFGFLQTKGLDINVVRDLFL